MRLLLTLALLNLTLGCAAAAKNFDQVPRAPTSHALDPAYIEGPLQPSLDETLVRRNLSRGSGFVFGTRFLFESDAYQAHQGRPAHPGSCFLFETDATEKDELDASNWEMKLESLDSKVSHPLSLALEPEGIERLKTEKLPFTVRGHACTPARLDYEEGFRVTALRKYRMKAEDGKAPPKPSVFEWLPWKPGISQDLERKRW